MTYPTMSALREDVWTCDGLLSLDLQRRRGFGWGNECRTLNLLPETGGILICSYCGQARSPGKVSRRLPTPRRAS